MALLHFGSPPIPIYYTMEREKAPELPDNTDEDMVNHPRHYTSDPSGVECITITRHRNFNIGNAIKYLWRQGLKNTSKNKGQQIEDLQKAIWYIEDEITRIKGLTSN